ncbi:MAG: hypothetical protein GY714_03715 [Desulfobacterales bacterium]|nr:hypothetical protein [Desulfobacterales bacterium]MCP4161814.1 hypothetical protein [Deltaproteobacteria bacterium]
MPFYLKEVDIIPEVEKCKSALIVICRFCPAASLAARKEEPYIEFFRRFLNTNSYEQLINNMQYRLEAKGLKTDSFRGGLLNFIICMWTSGIRQKLLKVASQYEAIVVMGCEAAYQSVCNILASTDCKIFSGMESEGVLEAIPKFHLPFSISLELNSVTPIHFPDQDEPEINP